MSHRCDPSQDPMSAPVTRLRVLRLLAAALAGPDVGKIEAALVELGDCPNCLNRVVIALCGAAAKAIVSPGQSHADALMAYELQSAAAEQATGWPAL